MKLKIAAVGRMRSGPEADLVGGCGCGAVRFRMQREPLIVHCCHCTWCQRQTGSAFVVNALVERSAVEVLRGEIEEILTPTESGRGQTICRCASCHVAVWSHYALGREHVAFVRVGTLDHSEALAPDVHIFTESTLPWVVLPEGAARFEQFYDPSEVWSAESAERYRRAVGRPGSEHGASVQRQVNDAGSLGSAPV